MIFREQKSKQNEFVMLLNGLFNPSHSKACGTQLERVNQYQDSSIHAQTSGEGYTFTGRGKKDVQPNAGATFGHRLLFSPYR